MSCFKRKLILSACFLLSLCLAVQAYTSEDINDFIKAGKACYRLGKLDEAALEFENVLIMDKTNFDAKIWLTQIYIDKKDIVHAKKILTEASLQNPKHNRVKELQKLLGVSTTNVKPNLVDPVIAETISEIASATKRRKYGLVVPESKVVEENLEKKLLTFNNETFDEKHEVIRNIEKAKEEVRQQSNKLDINNYVNDKTSPLAPVFALYNTYGLAKALDKYFEMFIKDPVLGSADDNGIVDEGMKFYSARYSENQEDLEACYYFGCLQYINGEYQTADDILKVFLKRPGNYGSRLKPFFTALNRWKEQEKQRIAYAEYLEAEKQAEEARKAKEAKEKEDDVWEKVKGQNASKATNKNGDLASSMTKIEAGKLHAEAYSLYKKGKLDESIKKYEEALAKDPDNQEFNYHLGLAWTDKGLAGDAQAFENAITAYQKVISDAPNTKLAKDAQSMIDDIRIAKQSLGEK